MSWILLFATSKLELMFIVETNTPDITYFSSLSIYTDYFPFLLSYSASSFCFFFNILLVTQFCCALLILSLCLCQASVLRDLTNFSYVSFLYVTFEGTKNFPLSFPHFLRDKIKVLGTAWITHSLL